MIHNHREREMFLSKDNIQNKVPVSIKIRVVSGCYHREHSPNAYTIIDTALEEYDKNDILFEEHESGPEIIAYLALGTATLTLTKSLIDLITAIINARAKGRKKGDTRDGDIVLIIRDTKQTNSSKEEFVLEVRDKELVDSKAVQLAIENGLNKKYKKK